MRRFQSVLAGLGIFGALCVSSCNVSGPSADIGRQIELLVADNGSERLIRMSDLGIETWDEIVVYGPYSDPALPKASALMKARFARLGIERSDGISAVALGREGRVVDVGQVRRDRADLAEINRLIPTDCLRLEEGWPKATKVTC